MFVCVCVGLNLGCGQYVQITIEIQGLIQDKAEYNNGAAMLWDQAHTVFPVFVGLPLSAVYTLRNIAKSIKGSSACPHRRTLFVSW